MTLARVMCPAVVATRAFAVTPAVSGATRTWTQTGVAFTFGGIMRAQVPARSRRSSHVHPIRVILLLGALTAGAPSVSDAANRVWDGGGGDANWMTAENWVGDVAPVPGSDTLEFPDGAAQKVNTNNFPAGSEFLGITFSGSGYTLNGNSILLSGDITAASGVNTIAVNVALTGATTISVNTNSRVIVSGIVSGAAGSLELTGGELWLSGENTYGGTTTVSGGKLVVFNDSGLGAGNGAPATGTTVNNGQLILGGVTIANERLILTGNGTLRAQDGENVLAGPVVLESFDSHMTVPPGNVLRFTGEVSGTGHFKMVDGGGTYILSNSGNDFGSIFWFADTSTVRNGGSDVIPNHVSLQIPPGATYDVNGFAETIGNLSGAGSVMLGDGFLRVIQQGNTTFSGVISGTGKIEKEAAGTLTLSGNSPAFTGEVTLLTGTVLVTGSIAARVNVEDLGTLGGTGTVGSIRAGPPGGTVAPGLSPGQLNSGGAVDFVSPTTYAVELNGAAPGTGYDRLNVSGPVSLGDATLSASLGFVPAAGAQFVIIDNEGSDPVDGTFAGLPEGATFSVGGQPFSITYAGGTGNDVVLRALAPVPTLPALWLIALGLLLAGLGVRALRLPPPLRPRGQP